LSGSRRTAADGQRLSVFEASDLDDGGEGLERTTACESIGYGAENDHRGVSGFFDPRG